ncbi:MAG TPA: hypothetical protein VL495_05980 [Edaphobacter sp.]|nr:hypothetical protein [Edaphobacter sp.]
MTTTPDSQPEKPGLKQRVAHELKDYFAISAYLAVLFCAIAAYTMLLARHFDDTSPLNFTFALINALVIGKIILIGQMFHLGHRTETLPLYQSALIKSFLFGVLIFLFHLVEEFIKRLIHHEPAGSALQRLDLEQLAARSIIILIALVPLFAFRELSRVLGESRLHDLFTQRSQLKNS